MENCSLTIKYYKWRYSVTTACYAYSARLLNDFSMFVFVENVVEIVNRYASFAPQEREKSPSSNCYIFFNLTLFFNENID